MSIKIVFNTRYNEAPCSVFYRDAFATLDGMVFSDWTNYDRYDIALFMTYEQDLIDLAEAKRNHPNLRVGLIDPRGSNVARFLKYIDFLVVDSLEMKDFFAGYQLPMFQYYEYPNIEKRDKNHVQKESVIIGYHGNNVHLAGMYPHVTRALEVLGKEYKIELWAIYNIENLGKCTFGLPGNIPVKHIQWSEENYYKYLTKVDIGIVPNLMPIKNINRMKKKAQVCRSFFNDSRDDYLIRFKMPSNPGRFIIFGKLGIPVVTDFYPSALQFIKDEHNGMLACSAGGWHRALRSLIVSAELRQKIADAMRKTIDRYFDFERQNTEFLVFLEKLLRSSPISQRTPIDEPADDIGRNFDFLKGVATIKIQQIQKKIAKAILFAQKSKVV